MEEDIMEVVTTAGVIMVRSGVLEIMSRAVVR
jgi:hypothetical protein